MSLSDDALGFVRGYNEALGIHTIYESTGGGHWAVVAHTASKAYAVVATTDDDGIMGVYALLKGEHWTDANPLVTRSHLNSDTMLARVFRAYFQLYQRRDVGPITAEAEPPRCPWCAEPAELDGIVKSFGEDRSSQHCPHCGESWFYEALVQEQFTPEELAALEPLTKDEIREAEQFAQDVCQNAVSKWAEANGVVNDYCGEIDYAFGNLCCSMHWVLMAYLRWAKDQTGDDLKTTVHAQVEGVFAEIADRYGLKSGDVPPEDEEVVEGAEEALQRVLRNYITNNRRSEP